MQAVMKIQGLEKAVRRKCDSYRRKLTLGKITPTTVRKFLDDNNDFLHKDMGSLERFGFRRVHNPPEYYGGGKEEETPPEDGCSCCLHRGGEFSKPADDDTLHMDFFRNTSLHGLKYIGQKKQHFVERIFWSVAFITGLVVAYYMISDVWGKYRNNSVIIAFAPFDTRIEEIPFPAITICSMNKVLKSKALQFMEEAKGSARLEEVRAARENLYYLNHVCSSSKSFTKTFNYSGSRGKIDQWSLHVTNRNENSYDGGKEDLWMFFLEASPSCSDMILKCTWQEEIKTCSELFTEIETDYGKCCTFNMAPPSVLHRYNETSKLDNKWYNWDGESLLKKPKLSEPSSGKESPMEPLKNEDELKEEKRMQNPNNEDSNPQDETPKRQKVPGKSFGLSILLNPSLDEYFCTTSDSVGFRLVTHLPIDVPHIGDLGSAIKPNSEVFINLRPEVTIGVKEAIKDFSLEQRQCYFNEEHKLGYYNYYSSSNCIDECIANLTYQECNCRRHYQPGDDSKLCGPRQFQCASSIKKKFVENYKTQCKMCIPTCTEIVYHTETTYTTMQSPEILWTDSKHQLAPWANKNVSIVHIYFGEGATNAKLRKELYGTVDLIANFGGLMGLCLGFSGLSLIEVIYFLTLHAYCRARRQRGDRQRQEGAMNWKHGMARSETTTELLNNEISCIPVYKSPNIGFQKTVDYKEKKQGLNRNLFAVPFSHNQY